MASESNGDRLPAARLVRWAGLFLLVLAGLVLYFRDGRRLPSFAPEAAEQAAEPTR